MKPQITAALGTLAVAAACAAPHQTPLAAPSFPDADSVHVDTITTGVTHSFIRDRRGPWAIHVVTIDSARCRPVFEARKPGRDVTARATTTQLAAGTLVTINADFFAIPGGTPVGPHVTGGTPLIGPTDRHAFAITAHGWRMGFARMDGRIAAASDTARIVQLNRMATRFSAYAGTNDGVTLFTAWMGDSIGADSTARRITIRAANDASPEVSGSGVIVAIDSPAPMTRMQRGEVVLHVHGSANPWARRRIAGESVSWHTAATMYGARIVEGVGGFPELLRDGRPVLADQTVNPSFGAQRHPRTAAGWTADGRLLFVAVDGRQPPYSDGMSLDELTWLFQRLGATDALNLDGGGSTALVVEGALVNRPSDAAGERAVGNAFALVRCMA
jgi:hypothetical protein